MEFAKKGFCFFLLDVLCSFRLTDKSVVMERCFRCSRYVEFVREMEEEEDAFFEEVERIRKYGYPRRLP